MGLHNSRLKHYGEVIMAAWQAQGLHIDAQGLHIGAKGKRFALLRRAQHIAAQG